MTRYFLFGFVLCLWAAALSGAPAFDGGAYGWQSSDAARGAALVVKSAAPAQQRTVATAITPNALASAEPSATLPPPPAATVTKSPVVEPSSAARNTPTPAPPLNSIAPKAAAPSDDETQLGTRNSDAAQPSSKR